MFSNIFRQRGPPPHGAIEAYHHLALVRDDTGGLWEPLLRIRVPEFMRCVHERTKLRLVPIFVLMRDGA